MNLYSCWQWFLSLLKTICFFQNSLDFHCFWRRHSLLFLTCWAFILFIKQSFINIFCLFKIILWLLIIQSFLWVFLKRYNQILSLMLNIFNLQFNLLVLNFRIPSTFHYCFWKLDVSGLAIQKETLSSILIKILIFIKLLIEFAILEFLLNQSGIELMVLFITNTYHWVFIALIVNGILFHWYLENALNSFPWRSFCCVIHFFILETFWNVYLFLVLLWIFLRFLWFLYRYIFIFFI